MKDSAPPELDRLLSCNIDELIASVHPMSAKICEQYARAILGRIGGPSYDQLFIRLIETMIPRDGRGPPNNSDEYYFAVRDLFPHVAAENDVLGRLLCLTMQMCLLRFERHHNFDANEKMFRRSITRRRVFK